MEIRDIIVHFWKERYYNYTWKTWKWRRYRVPHVTGSGKQGNPVRFRRKRDVNPPWYFTGKRSQINASNGLQLSKQDQVLSSMYENVMTKSRFLCSYFKVSHWETLEDHCVFQKRRISELYSYENFRSHLASTTFISKLLRKTTGDNLLEKNSIYIDLLYAMFYIQI